MGKSASSASGRALLTQRIEAGTRIEGHVRFQGSIEVAGTIVGTLLADPIPGSAVIVAGQGRVIGEVHADSVRVAGECIGPLTAEHSLVVEEGGRVEGQIRHRAVDIAQGAFVGGQLQHLDPGGGSLALRAEGRSDG